MKKLFQWIFGTPEPEFKTNQRVRLISNYPADLAGKAHNQMIYGTIQPKDHIDWENDYKRGYTEYPVKWDGVDGIRWQPATSISGEIFQ